MPRKNNLEIPVRIDDRDEVDYSEPIDDGPDAPSRDLVPIRSMVGGDLPALVAIDRRHTGHDRSLYFEDKLEEVLEESGVRVSLVAELDDRVVGFIMARVDFGEFGRAAPEAVIDTIGVDPSYRHRKIASALLSQLLANLGALHTERVRTEVDWNNFDLLSFLEQCGFLPSERLSFSRRLL